MRAETRLEGTVVVAASARPGEGGLGAAARDIADGFLAAGLQVTYVFIDSGARWQTVGGSRALARFRAARRQIDGATVARHVPVDPALAYVMPLCVPHGRPGTILHHATHHPRRAREQVARERRRTGGGAVLVGATEARRVEREIKRAGLIRVESELVYEQLLDAGVPSERVVRARPGVDLDRFCPDTRADVPLVAYVGSLALWKGLDVLSELHRSLTAGGARLEIIGNPVCRWSRRIGESLTRADTTAVPKLLGRAHALVLPSVADGFGYVVLEAMACGAVPFVTPAVGAAELVREVDPRLVIERNEFAHAVPALLATLPIEHLAERSRAIAERHGRIAMAEQAARALLAAARRRGMIGSE